MYKLHVLLHKTYNHIFLGVFLVTFIYTEVADRDTEK